MKITRFSYLLGIGMLLLACSEDDEKLVTVTPLFDRITSQGLEKTTYTDANPYSLGNRFTVDRSGKIVALGMASPVIGDFTLRVYQLTEDDATLLGSATVGISAEGVVNYGSLASAVTVEPGKTYCVAIEKPQAITKFYRIDDQTDFDLPLSQSFVTYASCGYGGLNDTPGDQFAESDILYLVDARFEFNE